MTFLFIFLGILPSLVWLSIYLREDDHPEPNSTILFTFLLGALAAPVAARVELFLIGLLGNSMFPGILANFLTFFVAIALVEEYVKYLAVRLSVEKRSVFDEPTDAMIYLIVSALGFAAVENVLALFSFVEVTADAFEITILRFLSATLLHVLASAVVGYYLARRHFFGGKGLVITGLIIATVVHGIYNILTLAANGFANITVTFYIVLLLATMSIVVNILFHKLKKGFYK